jgi:hypothetical protein
VFLHFLNFTTVLVRTIEIGEIPAIFSRIFGLIARIPPD